MKMCQKFCLFELELTTSINEVNLPNFDYYMTPLTLFCFELLPPKMVEVKQLRPIICFVTLLPRDECSFRNFLTYKNLQYSISFCLGV